MLVIFLFKIGILVIEGCEDDVTPLGVQATTICPDNNCMIISTKAVEKTIGNREKGAVIWNPMGLSDEPH